jgi:hypothetical protein
LKRALPRQSEAREMLDMEKVVGKRQG